MYLDAPICLKGGTVLVNEGKYTFPENLQFCVGLWT